MLRNPEGLQEKAGNENDWRAKKLEVTEWGQSKQNAKNIWAETIMLCLVIK